MRTRLTAWRWRHARPGLSGITALAAALTASGHAASQQPAAASSSMPGVLRSPEALLGIALTVLFLIWQRRILADVLAWIAITIGELLAPLRSRRHVIHDPTYLEKIIEADIEAERRQEQEQPPAED